MNLNSLKNQIVKTVIAIVFIFSQSPVFGQSNNQFPATFNITNTELNTLLNYKLNDQVSLKNNIYLNQGKVVYKYTNADLGVKQIKLELKYFKNAFLTVQINADDTRQIFVMSDKTEANYKNKSHKPSDIIIMEKCKKDDIISE